MVTKTIDIVTSSLLSCIYLSRHFEAFLLSFFFFFLFFLNLFIPSIFSVFSVLSVFGSLEWSQYWVYLYSIPCTYLSTYTHVYICMFVTVCMHVPEPELGIMTCCHFYVTSPFFHLSPLLPSHFHITSPFLPLSLLAFHLLPLVLSRFIATSSVVIYYYFSLLILYHPILTITYTLLLTSRMHVPSIVILIH